MWKYGCFIEGFPGMGGMFASDPFGFDMLGMDDPFSLAGPSLFMQPQQHTQ